MRMCACSDDIAYLDMLLCIHTGDMEDTVQK